MWTDDPRTATEFFGGGNGGTADLALGALCAPESVGRS
jgi:hypothetical protein